MNAPSRFVCASSIAAALATLILPPSASAQKTWTGATDATWDLGSNWITAGEPGALDDVLFPSPIPGTGATITLTPGELANSLDFQDAYTLTGGDLTLTTGNITVSPTLTATINSALAGAAGVNKLGAGTLVLGGTNTYSGATSISAGVLSFAASANLGDASATNTLAISNNATLRFTGSTATDLTATRALAIGAGGATIDQAGTAALTLPGVISSPAGTVLTKTGAGTVILTPASNANNGLLGDITVDAGTLQLGTVGATQYIGALGGNVAGRTITVNSGALVNFVGRDNSPALLSWVINGGTVRNTAGFNRLGPVTLNGGTINVVIGNSATFQALSFESTVTVTGTTPSTISGTGTNGNIHLEPAGGVTFDVADVTGSAAADLTVTSILMNNSGTAAARALTKTGAGTLVLNANNAYTGNTNINVGTVEIGGSGQIDGPTIVASGATLRISGGTDALAGNLPVTVNTGGLWEYNSSAETIGALTGGGTITRTVTGTGTITATNGGETATFSGVIENGTGGGVLALTKAGGGTFTLTGTNTYTGRTFMNNSVLVVTGSAGAIQGSTVVDVGDNNGGGETLTLGAGGDVWSSGTLDRLADTAVVTLNGTNAGGLNYNGPATTSTGNVETFGTLAISAGRNNVTVTPGTDNEVQLSANTLTRANNGTLLLRGNNLGGTGTGSTRVVFGTNPATSGGDGADGSTTVNIVNFAVGDDSSTGAGSGFLTHHATNGLRLLTSGEYAATIAGSDTPRRNVSVAGGETVTANEEINSLRVTGGTTTIAAGQRVLVNSGAVLLTGAHTISGAGMLDFGANPGIVHVAQNTTAVTAQLNARLGGTAGAAFGSTGSANNVLQLGGDNTLIGTVNVNSGILQAGSAGAFNDNYPVTVLARPGSTVRLNGHNIVLRDLQGSSGTGVYQNGAATPATLTTYLTGSRTLTPVLANGSTGALNLVVSAAGFTMTIDGDASATGTLELRGGTLQLSGTGGTLNDFTGYTIAGGTLQLTNTNTTNNGNRISGNPLTLAGGTLDFNNNASDASFSETVGAVTIAPGTNFITVDKATATNSRTSVLTLASLARNPGGTVVFNSQNNNTAIFDLGKTAQSRLAITTDPVLDDGIIGGWAVVQSSATAREFAKFITGASETVTAMVAADYTATLPGATSAQNVAITASPAALTSNTQINSLTLNQASATTVDIGAGNTMRVESGGIIANNAFNSSFTNGTLTAGTGDNAPGELIVHVVGNPMTIGSVIADNGAGSVALTKAGGGTLNLQGATNTYTGKTFHSGGTIQINADANLGTAPLAPSAGHLTFASTGTQTLSVTETMTLDANRSLQIGAGTTVISIAAGATAGTGKTLTYNGRITGTAEGNLTFQSNAASGVVGPGSISASLTDAITLGGAFQIENGSVTVPSGDSVIGRSLIVGNNGTASYIQTGGTLKVGAGINDRLDIGISAGAGVTKQGTLNLTGVSQFTANVDQVRIGVVTTDPAANGTAIFATNNDITAGTSILIGDSGGAGLGTQTLTFGTGTHNLTTRTMTLGGRKAIATLAIGADATINLQGFGQRTLDLFIGRQNVDTAGINTSEFNASNGTVKGSFNNLTIGLKSATGTNTGGADAVLTLGASADNFIEANTVTLGSRTQNTGTAAAGSRAFGTINMAGGTFTVLGNVDMGTLANNGTAKGMLNLTGGTFTLGGNITKTDNDRSSAVITLDGPTAVLDLRNDDFGDTTMGTMALGQLVFRQGTIQDVASVTLDGRGVTSGNAFAALDDALVLRDVDVDFAVNLTNAAANKGGIKYEATGGGAGGSISGAVDLGAVVRGINVEDSPAAGADLTIGGSISGTLGGLNKTGAGTLVLTVGNSYSGGTTLADGGLIATANGALGGGNVSVLGTAISLSIGTGITNAIADSATLSLAGGGLPNLADAGFMILNTGVNEQVAGLLLGGVAQPDGTYGATGSGATFINDEYFSGAGIVTVMIPEPGSLATLLGGLAALGAFQRLRRRKA